MNDTNPVTATLDQTDEDILGYTAFKRSLLFNLSTRKMKDGCDRTHVQCVMPQERSKRDQRVSRTCRGPPARGTSQQHH
jgi:hypothetical protein